MSISTLLRQVTTWSLRLPIRLDASTELLCGSCFLVYFVYKTIEWLESPADSSRAPMVKFWIPWLGSAIELGKDQDAFFKRASQTLGPVFRAKSAGLEYTYVTSPELISSVYRDSKTFVFTPIRLEVTCKIFGGTPECVYSPRFSGELFDIFHQALSPKHVVGLHQSYAKFAHECILAMLQSLDGESKMPLSTLVKRPAFDAALYAFFGKTIDAAGLFDPFRKFDDNFLMFQAGLPRFLMKDAYESRQKLVRLLMDYLSQPHEDCSELVTNCEELAKDAQWSLEDTAGIFLNAVWALQANAINVAYWFIAYQLNTQHGLTPIIEEIDAARSSSTQRNQNDKDEGHYDWILQSQFPLLTSAIQEVLRLSSSTFSIREVAEPTVFAGYKFSKGERIICATRFTHLDNEIHQNSGAYNPKRYLQGEKFVKGGQPVANHSMPFGGGVSMCEGRHFALGELKIYIALLLSMVNICADTTSLQRPKLLKSRIGLGIMPPDGDLKIKVWKRAL